MIRIRVGTWNLQEYRPSSRRQRRIVEVIRGLDCDVLAVQEVCGHGRHTLEHLARETGLSCWYEPPWICGDDAGMGEVAVAGTEPRSEPRRDSHVGLLWNSSTVRAYPDGFRGYPGGGEFWHGLAMQAFAVEGLDRPLHVGSYHGVPFAQDQRPDEARRVVSALTRPDRENRLAIVGADWRSISADRVQHPDGSWTFWHPDPYWSEDGPHEWREVYGYQCIVTEDDEQGRPTRWHADRRPGEVLLRAGCRDTAALAAAEWAPSTGHAGDDDAGSRTIDTLRVSPALTPAVIGWEVVSTDVTGTSPTDVSNHLPVVATLDPHRLPVTT